MVSSSPHAGEHQDHAKLYDLFKVAPQCHVEKCILVRGLLTMVRQQDLTPPLLFVTGNDVYFESTQSLNNA